MRSMLHRTAIAIAALLPLLTASATAAPLLTIDAGTYNYGQLYFTPVPGTRAATQGWALSLWANSLWVDGVEWQILTGNMDITSGLFLDYDLAADGNSATTMYGDNGRFEAAFTIGLPGGSTHDVVFGGRLGPMTIHEYFPGVGTGFIETSLEDGKFDQATAAMFGISPHILPSAMYLYTDVYVWPIPPAPNQEHFDAVFGYIDFNAQVPEPTTGALISLGVAGLWSRRLFRSDLQRSRTIR